VADRGPITELPALSTQDQEEQEVEGNIERPGCQGQAGAGTARLTSTDWLCREAASITSGDNKFSRDTAERRNFIALGPSTGVARVAASETTAHGDAIVKGAGHQGWTGRRRNPQAFCRPSNARRGFHAGHQSTAAPKEPGADHRSDVKASFRRPPNGLETVQSHGHRAGGPGIINSNPASFGSRHGRKEHHWGQDISG